MKYKRLLLKISGESLMGKEPYGLCPEATERVANELKAIQDGGFELAVVIGGGNIFRGIHHEGMGLERAPADNIGMLATVINGIALTEALKKAGCSPQLMSAIDCPKVAEAYNWQRANHHMQMGRLLVFVGGTGNPYFTTDTAAALRASEIKADMLLKATKVDGIYDKDPLKYSDAKHYSKISYREALSKQLEVMDSTAFALCMANRIPLYVFNMAKLANFTIEEILSDDHHGTLVTEDE